jgi:hypothetical protein
MKWPDRDDTGKWMGAVAALFVVLYAAFIARTTFTVRGQVFGTLFDDALISLRYAANLAQGHGLVWNPGEWPRVEGYTNLGWTAAMSLICLVFSRPWAPLAVSCLSAAMLLRAGLRARQLLATAGASPTAQLAGAILVLAYFPAMFWSLRGMEVGVLSWLLIEAVIVWQHLVESPSWRRLAMLALISGLAFLVRNDSLLVFGIVLAAGFVRAGIRMPNLVALVPFALCFAIQVGIRIAYYGDWVPNTYTLKMTGVPLNVRIASGGLAALQAIAPLVLPLALCVVGMSRQTRPTVRTLCRITVAATTIQFAYLVWIGGDAWLVDYSNRFVATIAPLVLIGAAATSSELAQNRSLTNTFGWISALAFVCVSVLWARSVTEVRPLSGVTLAVLWIGVLAIAAALTRLSVRRLSALALVSVTAGACFVFTSGPSWIRWVVKNAAYVRDDIAFSKQGQMLRETLPADAVIAATWLGAPSYFSGLESIDLFGKTDKHVAHLPGMLPFKPGHNKMDLAYSVGRLRPDVVLYDSTQLQQFGYTRLLNGLWTNDASTRLSPATTARLAAWCDPPACTGRAVSQSIAFR